jgi:hypothetical protein
VPLALSFVIGYSRLILSRGCGGRTQECLTPAVEIFLFFNPGRTRSVTA